VLDKSLANRLEWCLSHGSESPFRPPLCGQARETRQGSGGGCCERAALRGRDQECTATPGASPAVFKKAQHRCSHTRECSALGEEARGGTDPSARKLMASAGTLKLPTSEAGGGTSLRCFSPATFPIDEAEGASDSGGAREIFLQEDEGRYMGRWMLPRSFHGVARTSSDFQKSETGQLFRTQMSGRPARPKNSWFLVSLVL
jgi:hypothetical protein